MNAETPKQPSVFILDFWSDHNRGDAAMQVALLSMLESRSDGLELCTEYGCNQRDDALGELDHVAKIVDPERIHGGVRRTAYPIGRAAAWSQSRRAAAKILDLLDGALVFATIMLLGHHARPILRGHRARVFDSLRSADVVVWNGRNFRSRRTSTEPYDLWSLLFNPMVALRLGKPVYAIGVSCWPLKTNLGRRWLRFIFNRCQFVSAREDATFEYLHGLMPEAWARSSLHRLPDLSFAFLREHLLTPRPIPPTASSLRLALTLVDWGESARDERDRYVEALAQFLRGLSSDRRVDVIVVPQVPYGPQGYSTLIHELERRSVDANVSFEVIEGSPSIHGLVEIYETCDLLLGTRMHSVIFAWCAGTPALGIAYDEGAKWKILGDLGVDHLILPMQRVSSTKLQQAYSELLAVDFADVAKRIQSACDRVELNVSLWADAP